MFRLHIISYYILAYVDVDVWFLITRRYLSINQSLPVVLRNWILRIQVRFLAWIWFASTRRISHQPVTGNALEMKTVLRHLIVPQNVPEQDMCWSSKKILRKGTTQHGGQSAACVAKLPWMEHPLHLFHHQVMHQFLDLTYWHLTRSNQQSRNIWIYLR